MAPEVRLLSTKVVEVQRQKKLCRVRNIVLLILLGAAFTFAFVGYFCSRDGNGSMCPLFGMARVNGELMERIVDPTENQDNQFRQNGDDVLVFLHIQKTGGTSFGRHLVRNMQIDPPCVCFKKRKKCNCVNKNNHVWLFSRFSTGWPCGVHADWTELKECVAKRLNKIEKGRRKRRYLYITILRDPIKRFISEWRHVERGATWKNARLKCNGRRATLEEVPRCYDGEDWVGVSLDDFMKCPHNLANNRQTRMTANLSLIGCYNRSLMTEEQRNVIMLKSAMENLANMAFIGFVEHQLWTQYLFERTFGLTFDEDFIQVNISYTDGLDLTPTQKQTIESLNALDLKLYEYGHQLFMERLRKRLLNDTRALRQLEENGIAEPEKQTTEVILNNIRVDKLTSGRPANPDSYWIRRMTRKRTKARANANPIKKKRKKKKPKEDFWQENDIIENEGF